MAEPMFQPEPTAYPDFRVTLTLTVEQFKSVRLAFECLDSEHGLNTEDTQVWDKLDVLSKGVAEWKRVNGVK